MPSSTPVARGGGRAKRSTFPMTVYKVPQDSHWKLQFSNPENGPKSEENDPPHYQKAGYGPVAVNIEQFNRSSK